MKSRSFCHLLPSLVSAHSIQSIALQRFEHSKHRVPRRFRVAQDVAALLRVDASDAVPGYGSVDLLRSMRPQPELTAYRRLPDKRSAIGAAGSMMVSHVLITSTSRMALRETFLRFDFEPRVATSLRSGRSANEVGSSRKWEAMITRRLRRHTCARSGLKNALVDAIMCA
jgi:hypothetical protein